MPHRARQAFLGADAPGFGPSDLAGLAGSAGSAGSTGVSGTGTKPRQDRSGGSGFTLAELVVVMAVIGIMLGLLVPRLGLFSSEGDLKAALRTLSGLLAEGRNQAMMNGQPRQVRMDLESGRCWLEGTQGTQGIRGRRSLPDGLRAVSVSFQRSEPITSGVADITILPSGLARPTLIVLRGGNQAYTLSVRAFDAKLAAYVGEVDWRGLAEAEPW